MLRPFAIFALLGITTLHAAEPNRPNILFVFFDDMSWSDLGCYGGQVAKTPHLDQFASEGIRFTDAYAAMPNCTPSRACLISGQTSPRHGIYTVSPSDGKVAEKTAYEAHQARQKLLSVVNNHTLPADLVALPAALEKAGYKTAFTGKWHHSPSPEELGFSEVFRPAREEADPKQMFTLTQAASDFINTQSASDQPWFCYLSHHVPHTGVEARPATLARYTGTVPADSPVKPDYAAMIDDADASFGQLMASLDASGQADDTVVVVFSDNGGFLSKTTNAPLRDGKGNFYEGGIREPLLVRWPGQIEAGITQSTPVHAVDLFPTFIELAGGTMPADQIADGISILPLLKGQPTLERDALYWHFPHYNPSFNQPPCSVIRKGDHKLIHFYDGDRDELYNLATDLGETIDLSTQNPDLVAELKTQLTTWLTEAQAFIPTANPDYDPSKAVKSSPKASGKTPPKKKNNTPPAKKKSPPAKAAPQKTNSAPTPAAENDIAHPNVILVMADDLGYDFLGCNGGTSYPTPHLDRLAAAGARFTHCYSQPLCTPSRVQIMTGLYNYRNYTRFSELDAKQKTFGHFMQDAGYVTAFVHKWQLGKEGPGHFGFDRFAYHQPSRSHWGMNIVVDGDASTQSPETYGPDFFTDYAIDFIEENKAKPFFLYFPIWLTHEPFDATPDSVDPRGRSDRKHFGDMLTYLDKLMGRLDAKLDELGLRENTLFLFTGDNGTVQGIPTETSHGTSIGGKSQLTDAGTHVPLIASWPGKIKPGTVIDDLIDFTDFVPTVVDAAGGTLPSGLPFDGRSFLPRLIGGDYQSKDWILLTADPRKTDKSLPPGKRNQGKTLGPKKACVRDQRWKLYYTGEFFDLTNDPLEESPLTGELTPEASTAKARLAQLVKRIPALGKPQTKPAPKKKAS